MSQLEKDRQLKRVGVEVDPRLEMTEICDRVCAPGPAILSKARGRRCPGPRQPVRHAPQRVAPHGRGGRWKTALREVGKLLAVPGREPEPPEGLEGRLGQAADSAKQVLNMAPRGGVVGALPGVVREGAAVDLRQLPIQHCWPGDAAPPSSPGGWSSPAAAQGAAEPRHLPPAGARANKLIMRWLAHRGGALISATTNWPNRPALPVAVPSSAATRRPSPAP